MSEKVRARGKKGRARQTEDVRRPGVEPERGGAAAAPAAVYPAQGNGGRRTHRGASRTDPVPMPSETAMEGVTKTLASVSMSDTGGRGRTRVTDRYGNDDTRPQHVTDKKGTSGSPITLAANFFELQSQPSWCVYQYHCDFAPVVESSRLRRSMLHEHENTIGIMLFDGMSDLKTVRDIGEGAEFFSQRRTDGENIRITLKRVGVLAPSHPEMQRLFNTLMRRNLRILEFSLLGRHFFDSKAISDVPGYNLQVWQGVTTAIRQQEERIMMCVDTVHKVVRQETALQIIANIVRSMPGQNYRDAVARELVGDIVMTKYNNRTYRIEDIDWSQCPKNSFETSKGPVVYLDYYKKEYEIKIQDEKQPLLLCTSKMKEIKQGASTSRKIYLVPELCYMTGITDSMRANFTTMKEISKITKVDPQKRVEYLQRFIDRVRRDQKVMQNMTSWNLSFSENLVRFTGRVVPAESIVLQNIKRVCNQTEDFTRNIRSDPMHKPVDLLNWVLICTKYDRETTNNFLSSLKRVSGALGMRVNYPRVLEIPNDRIDNYFRAFRDSYNSEVQLVSFVVPNNKKERYDALKKYTCCDNAVPSQVLQSKTISKPKTLMTVATKVAIQLNCKLGGEPWTVHIPIKARIMICGYDTYHDSSRKGQSAGAFVASMNADLSRWYSKVTFHSAGGWEELSNHMRTNFIEALKRFQQFNGVLPEIIILYRDGVGDGQIRYVQEWEVQQFKRVINDCMQGKDVRYGFIIVNKRVSARFFHSRGQGRYNNPPHGTVIDNTVTRYDRYDFYLVSQVAREGTVSPTMYNVIEDNTRLAPEYLQRLTYKLTHMYYNFSGTISVPAPCQYAHKLAFLAGQSLHMPPKDELSNTLFYL